MADLGTVKKAITTGNPLIDGVTVTGNTGLDAKYKVYIESQQQSVEPFYFWILNFLQKTGRFGLNFERIEKIKDVFSASETSSYWGDVEARRAIQQDRFEKYMTNIGAMTKSLIQQALREDIGKGDITTNALIQQGAQAKAVIIAKQN